VSTKQSTRTQPQRGLPARMWTHQETAEFLGVPEGTLHQMNSKGTGPRSYRVGRYRRYDPRDIEVWLDARASSPRSA
jgi:predicted DNA-binding transcriptional regulator AlpA